MEPAEEPVHKYLQKRICVDSRIEGVPVVYIFKSFMIDAINRTNDTFMKISIDKASMHEMMMYSDLITKLLAEIENYEIEVIENDISKTHPYRISVDVIVTTDVKAEAIFDIIDRLKIRLYTHDDKKYLKSIRKYIDTSFRPM